MSVWYDDIPLQPDFVLHFWLLTNVSKLMLKHKFLKLATQCMINLTLNTVLLFHIMIRSWMLSINGKSYYCCFKDIGSAGSYRVFALTQIRHLFCICGILKSKLAVVFKLLHREDKARISNTKFFYVFLHK